MVVIWVWEIIIGGGGGYHNEDLHLMQRYLFFVTIICCYCCPFLVYFLGEDAVKFESLPDEVIVAKALSVLRSIFGDTTVPEVLMF